MVYSATKFPQSQALQFRPPALFKRVCHVQHALFSKCGPVNLQANWKACSGPSARDGDARHPGQRSRHGINIGQVHLQWVFSSLSEPEGGSDVALSSAVAIASALGLSLDWLLSEPVCETCDEMPPAGFICTECGRSARCGMRGSV